MGRRLSQLLVRTGRRLSQLLLRTGRRLSQLLLSRSTRQTDEEWVSQMMGRWLSQLCAAAGRTDHRELPEVPGVMQGTRS
jgi:hypothetical protein